MVNIEPSFEIDEKGRVICQSHSKFPYFIQPSKSYLEERQMENELTCLTCSHYESDYCFFPKSEIDKIELDRLNRSRFQCKLCGNKIDRMLTIMQKIYYEVKFNMKMPLICCSCYERLQQKKFGEYYIKRIWESLSFYLPSIFLIFNPFPFSIFAVLSYIAFIIVFKIIIKQKTHYSLFLMDLIKGKKFYDKNFKEKIESS
ncbi:MAG: hypothetical protein KGD68_01400 [Candidatus Lokiarchaeota archaeon]|nr:hypothetical protein [Candidatus Lokiarchaeota archaeon]